MHLTSVLASALAATLVSAHPGHDVAVEAKERREAMSMMTRSDLSHCAEKIKARGLEAASIARREALANKHSKRGLINARDGLNKSHASTEEYTLDTPESTIFASNSSCILSPEVTEGPYYVAGEYIRKNVIETQPGVELVLDIQVLDIETCEPISDAFVEIWHCNSTGVYGGVNAGGNGNTADLTNINATFLRGVQQSDAEGVAIFETLVPGHYTGRTPHVHVMVHTNGTAAANGTLLDLSASHVGQFFFDQDLITEVEKTDAYKTNTQTLTLNANDGILGQSAEGASDPFIQYVYLGDDITDGLLGWIAFGVNTTLGRTVRQAVTLYETGGVANPNSGGGGGGPGGPPSGFPSGGFPGGPTGTGVPPSASSSAAPVSTSSAAPAAACRAAKKN
ncbi:extracellular dioxygenase-like protein [Bombardia bombarda]|uniref:Extracellular dioxygenase-like protein n=1 Tax=Bombardia bombarda TaxID=252184 RepID=A0AA40C8U7_9PEZI|nr:extracellular dioxygenase-like protein [Bombardia bombarda]